MTDPADRFLEEKLHALARGVSVPVVPTDDDVRRGRRRLFRMRAAMAGATTATVAVVLGVTSLTAGNPKATEAPLVESPSTAPALPTRAPSADGENSLASDPTSQGGKGNQGTGLGAGPGSQNTERQRSRARTPPRARPPAAPPRTKGPAPGPTTGPASRRARTRRRSPARR